jgi:hypothetical protein
VIRGGRPVADLPQETRTGQRDDRRTRARSSRRFPALQKAVPFHQASRSTALLRNSDVQQLFTDPRTRQSEKEFFELRGIQEAPCSICSNIQWSPRMDLTIVGAGRRSQRRSPFAR